MRTRALLATTCLTAIVAAGDVMAQTVLPSSSTTLSLATFATGNPFTVNAGTTISGSGTPAMVFGNATSSWTLNTNGIIANTAANASGIEFDNGGSITNGATNAAAQITGVLTGILIQGANPASLVNSGIISGGQPSNGAGVRFNNGGTITNTATGSISSIGNGTPAVQVSGAAGTITNAGAITGPASGFGIVLQAGGTVTNQVGGAITAGGSTISGAAVTIAGAAGSVENFGRIAGASGTFGTGIDVEAGGTVTNHTGATISGGDTGVTFNTPAPNTVVNDGAITATSASSGIGVRMWHGTVTNGANDPTATISGTLNGIQFQVITGGGTVNNSGTISATGSNLTNLAAIFMRNGGTVTNNPGGHITATGVRGAGVLVQNDSGTVDNSGAITGGQSGSGNTGVWLTFGGSVTNRAGGSISSATTGIEVDARTGTIVNSGTIAANSQPGGTGVLLNAGGSVTNTTGGAILGSQTGVTGNNGLAVDSSGLILGGTNAVQFVAGANTLALRSGSTTVGTVLMGSGTDLTTVFGGADISGVPLFNGGTGISNLTFDGYVGAARAVSAWQQVLVTNGANVSFDGADNHAAALFRVDSGATLGFSSQTGTLTGDVSNAGTLDYSAGNGSGAYTITGTLTNSGLVRLAGTAGVPGNTLTVTNYVGQGGALAFNTFLGTDGSPSDRLVINTGTATGSSTLRITNAGGPGAATVSDGILVVDTINGGTTAPGTFTLGNIVAAGAYEYLLFRGGVTPGTEQNWFLRSQLIPPPPPPPPPGPPPSPPPPPPPPPTPLFRPEAALYASLPAVARASTLATLDTFHERQGEQFLLRGNANFTAAWGRVFGQHTDQRLEGPFQQEFNGTITGFQGGVDLLGWERGLHRDRAGLFAAFSQADMDVRGFAIAVPRAPAGSITLDTTSVGAYWTHIGPAAWYVDAVLMGTFFDSNARSIRGNFGINPDGTGITASVESGVPIWFGPAWTIEPQVQLIFQHVDFDDAADPFSRVSFQPDDAVTGRVGLRLTNTFQWLGATIQPYLRANLWHQFSGTDVTQFNLASFGTPLEATSVEVGGGVVASVNAALGLFATGSYVTDVGGVHQETFKGRLGMRYTW